MVLQYKLLCGWKFLSVRFLVMVSVLWLPCHFVALGSALAASAFDSPMLLLDPGMHVDPIQKMAMDRDERILATISLDKTVRIWKLPNLKIWKTLRVPMISGGEGRLYALAVSPSGGIIATAGDTCKSWNLSYCIYVFNTQSGSVQYKIAGLPEQINDLAFSPDGQYLAAVMANSGGMRVFRTSDGHQVAQDGSYGGNANSVRFSSSGQVVSTSTDGKVRLYDTSFHLEQTKPIPSGLTPRMALFSPDGSKIAVSFLGKPIVSVLSGRSLEILYLPDMTGVSEDIVTLAWSLDGKSLYGAGKHTLKFKRMLRWWSNGGQTDTAGKGEFIDIPVSDSPIQYVLPFKDGGVLFTSLSSALGQVDSQGFLGTVRKYPNVLFPQCRGFLLISPSADTVSFPMNPENTVNGSFSLSHMQFSINQSKSSQLMVPKRRAVHINLQAKMQNSSLRLTLDDKEVDVQGNEEISCFAIANDERFFIVSTNRALYMYDGLGALRWRFAVDSPIRALNISEKGKHILVALTNGTVNWLAVVSGKPVLSFFVNAENGEWIVWSPDYFYYTASKNAENYLGWHKNKELDQEAQFTPISKMNTKLNKPAILQKILK